MYDWEDAVRRYITIVHPAVLLLLRSNEDNNENDNSRNNNNNNKGRTGSYR